MQVDYLRRQVGDYKCEGLDAAEDEGLLAEEERLEGDKEFNEVIEKMLLN